VKGCTVLLLIDFFFILNHILWLLRSNEGLQSCGEWNLKKERLTGGLSMIKLKIKSSFETISVHNYYYVHLLQYDQAKEQLSFTDDSSGEPKTLIYQIDKPEWDPFVVKETH